MDQYPRMLYRPGNGPSEIWGELVDTLIVNSAAEESSQFRQGWLNDPSVACAKARKRRSRAAAGHWFASHWKFWITTSIAIAAVVVAFMAIR